VPALLGFVAFLFSFPIYRRIPFWPHLTIADAFTLWFEFVTPITTAIGFVVLMRYRRSGRINKFARTVAWTAITLSVLVNVFMWLAAWSYNI
jgi:hypothetical protein